VGFHFFALLLPGNDDIVGIPASIDDGLKVTRGEVMEVTAPLLVSLDGAVPALGALRIDEPWRSFLILSASSTLMLDEDSLSIVLSTSLLSGSRR
jgi:hypothetical protein